MASQKGKGLEPENRLSYYLDEKAWSIAELARRAGITDKTVRRMLNRQKTARVSKIKVAKPFGISAKKIFPDDPEL